MSLAILKRPSALRDLEECFVYIAEDDLDIATEFLIAVEDSLDQLATMPLMGKVVELDIQVLAGIRVWPVKGFKAYLIFYFASDDSIELVRVLHSSRDVEGLLS